MRKKKRPLSLLEVTIGLTLTAILLTALFSSFRQIIQTNVKLQKARNEMHGYFVLQMRLSQVFESVQNSRLQGSETSIHFSFDNGIDPEPEFCQKVAALFVANEKELSLKLQSKTGKERKEIFLKSPKSLSFSYFDPKEKTWVKKWNNKTLPPQIKIEMGKEKWTFLLPRANQKIVYS